MADEATPGPTYDELVAENAVLRARVSRLESAIGQKDGEIRALRKKPARVLDINAEDAFDRPYMGQAGGRR